MASLPFLFRNFARERHRLWKKKKYREIFSRRTKIEMEIRGEFIFYDEIDENYFPRVTI